MPRNGNRTLLHQIWAFRARWNLCSLNIILSLTPIRLAWCLRPQLKPWDLFPSLLLGTKPGVEPNKMELLIRSLRPHSLPASHTLVGRASIPRELTSGTAIYIRPDQEELKAESGKAERGRTYSSASLARVPGALPRDGPVSYFIFVA